LHIYCIYIAYKLHIYYIYCIYITYILHVYCIYITHILHIYYIYVYYMYIAYILHIYCMYITYILHIYCMYIAYTGWPVLIHPVEYLENQARERKMFQTKVVWFWGGHKMVPLVWPWRVIWRSREGHFNFLKWNTLYTFTYSCSLSRELSKTL